MKLDLTGLHADVTEAIQDFTEKKIEKLEKFFDDDTICHVTFHPVKDKIYVDIRIEYKSRTYIAEEKADDLYYGVEKIVEKIEGQIRKNKAIIDKKRKQGVTEEVLDNLTMEDLEKEIEE